MNVGLSVDGETRLMMLISNDEEGKETIHNATTEQQTTLNIDD